MAPKKSLAERMARVKSESSQLDDPGHGLQPEDMGHLLIDWGKNKGSSFAHIYETDPSYASWAAGHFPGTKCTRRQEHFLAYLEARVSSEETELGIDPEKPSSSAGPVSDGERVNQLESDVAGLTAQMSTLSATISDLAERSNTIESVLSQVGNALPK